MVAPRLMGTVTRLAEKGSYNVDVGLMRDELTAGCRA